MKEKDIQTQLNDLQKQISNLENSITRKSSPAKLRAEKKYYSTITPYSLRFNKNEQELWEHLNKQENKAKYLKSLIAEDMGYKNFSHFHGITPTFAQTERWNNQKENILKSYNEKRRWSLKHLIDYIDENEIGDGEWEQIKQLFICDEDNITKVYCEAGFNGALPYEAWTSQLIKDKLNDKFIELAIPKTIDVNNIPEKQLKSYLIKCWLFDPNSKLEKHISFYRIDAQQFLDDFNIDIDITERYRELTGCSPENPNPVNPFQYPKIPKKFQDVKLD